MPKTESRAPSISRPRSPARAAGWATPPTTLRTGSSWTAASSSSAAGTLGSQNHLQQAAGVVEQVLEFVAGGAQHFRGKVCGGFYSGDRGILGNVTNLIYPDTGFASESGFKVFREGRRFCVASWKGANETGELRLGKRRRKVDAGDTGRN